MDKLLHENMIWHDTNEINKYTENTIENRKKPAKNSCKNNIGCDTIYI